MKTRRAVNKGFSLIEVLIAMLVLAVGILGAGALQTVGMQVTQGSGYRSQAVILASEMVDRMYVNRAAVANYAPTNTGAVAIAAAPACLVAASGCTPAQIATADISSWTANLAALPNGSGTILRTASGDYAVTVSWNENEWTGATRGSTAQTFQLIVSI